MMRRSSPLKKLLGRMLCLLAVLWGAAFPALAAGGGPPLTIIRDTEIETTLKEWADPVIRAAGLDPANVHIILVRDPAVNAFVAGGPNIFVYTGLLEKSRSADEVVGVLAHEMGHIAGGHLIRGRAAMERASYESMLGTILGIGAAVLTGQGQAGAAISAGSQSMALRNFLSHSRVQESSADQAALSFMQRAQINPTGLLDFLGRLESEELLPTEAQSEYVRTHPLTRNRVDALRQGVRSSAWKDKIDPDSRRQAHARMKAKLIGFISPEQVAWTYDDRDRSIAARYARTIADWQMNHVDAALSGADDLLSAEPDNPYFLEVKAQMLTEFGRVRPAIPLYRRALERLPDADLIRVDLARVMIETSEDDPKSLAQAIALLERAAQGEDRSPLIQRLLATAWGKRGNEPLAQMYLAEEALLQRRIPDARKLAEQAMAGLPESSRERIRARDILNAIERAEAAR